MKNMYNCNGPISIVYTWKAYNKTWELIEGENDQNNIERTMQRMDGTTPRHGNLYKIQDQQQKNFIKSFKGQN